MKTITWNTRGAALLALLLNQPLQSFGETNLNFNGVSATVEGAIRLSWNSTTNEVYEVQYADSLIDTNTGTTTWIPLYTDYPSHGTNTFWLDTGDYNLNPPVLHPRNMPMRFYRIYNLGTNTGPAPSISITSPSNGVTVSGNLTVTVNASSSNDLVKTLLFVDGQEMPWSKDGTNFVINTCEWSNGTHVLFAVAKSQFGLEGTPGDTSVTYGRAVSPYVNVTFDNLITRFSWTIPYFEPALGQTQQVSALFAANVNWTLQIQDVNTNTVLATNGAGVSMLYNWTGTGQGGTNIADGVYTFLLSAYTNGGPYEVSGGGSGGPTNGPPPPPSSASSVSSDSSSDSWYPKSAREALAAGLTSYYVEPPPMPPVEIETNGGWAFVPWEDVYGPEPPIEVEIPLALQQRFLTSGSLDSVDSGASLGPLALDANTPTNQSNRGPVRPPNIPGKGTIGTVGIGYQTYVTASGTYTTPPILKTPPPIPTYIALDGRSQSQASQNEPWGSIKENTDLCNGFTTTMKNGRYNATVVKVNDAFTSSDLKTGAFNQVNVGLVALHGSYATTAELDGIRHVYLRFRNSGGSTDYAKLDECSFGGSGTNGLKWMALLICDVLHSGNYDDLYNNSLLPINNDLHLLLGTSTLATAAPDLGKFWAFDMLGAEAAALTVEQAWYQAGRDAYKAETDYPNLIINFRVAGWPDAFSEKLTDVNNTPGTGNPADITKTDEKVHPLP